LVNKNEDEDISEEDKKHKKDSNQDTMFRKLINDSGNTLADNNYEKESDYNTIFKERANDNENENKNTSEKNDNHKKKSDYDITFESCANNSKNEDMYNEKDTLKKKKRNLNLTNVIKELKSKKSHKTSRKNENESLISILKKFYVKNNLFSSKTTQINLQSNKSAPIVENNKSIHLLDEHVTINSILPTQPSFTVKNILNSMKNNLSRKLCDLQPKYLQI
jgi:hypothetical protein